MLLPVMQVRAFQPTTKGLYFLQIQTEEGIAVKRFIKE